MSLFGDHTIAIPCSNCSQEMQKKVSCIKRNNHFICTCGSRVTWDTSPLDKMIAALEKDLNLRSQ